MKSDGFFWSFVVSVAVVLVALWLYNHTQLRQI